MARKGKKNQTKQEVQAPQPELTEWQKRNLEFQQKKRERKLAQAQAEEAEREAKRAALLAETGQEPERPQVKKKVLKSRRRSAPTATSLAWQKALPLFLFAMLTFVLSAVMVSPLSKRKLYAIQGATNTADQAIIEASGIKTTDYISQILLNLKQYEAAIVKNDPWVKSAQIAYQFPNRFLVKVEENQVLAYRQAAEGYQPILESGRIAEPVNGSQLPETFLTIDLDKDQEVKSLVTQLMTVDASIRQGIQSISRLPQSATKDLLLLMMADGHQIRVPLSQVAEKLPYYQTIQPKLLEPSIVDMEVGIYATTEALEAMAAETKASYEAEQKRLEEEAKEKDKKSSESRDSSSQASDSTSSSSTSPADAEAVTESQTAISSDQ